MITSNGKNKNYKNKRVARMYKIKPHDLILYLNQAMPFTGQF